MDNSKLKKMTEEPVEKLICTLAVPAIISMLITSIYNMADTYFVGQVGTSATAAVGIAYPLMSLIQALSFFFGHGSGNFISRRLGANDEEKAKEMGSTGFFSAVITGAFITVLGLVFIIPLCKVLGATETMLPHTVKYIFYILLGIPFISASFVLNNILRFQGNAFYGMIGMSVGAVLNIILDPIFIFGFDMGASGAGLATLIGQFAGCIVLFILNNRKSQVKIYFKNARFKTENFKEIIRGGIPSLSRQGLMAVATIILNNIVGIYGDAAVAAMSIVSRVGMMALSAVIGFGQGFQPVCGFNYGAKKYERVRKAFWFSTILVTGILIVVSLVGFIFAKEIITLFRDDIEVIEIGTFTLKAHLIVFPLAGFNVMANMYLQTIGKAVWATLVSMARQFLFFVPALLILSRTLDLYGIQITQPVADIFSFVFAIPVTISVLNKMK